MLAPAKRAEKVFGLDASLTSTGYAVFDDNRLKTGRVVATSFRGPKRLWFIRTKIEALLDAHMPDLVSMEGYAMGARGNVFNIGELGGVLQTAVWERGIDLVLVPPKTMKSVIALSGKAEKSDIIAALQTRYGLAVAQHDEADATGLLIVGELIRGIRRPPESMQELKRHESIKQLPITKGKMKSYS